MIRMFYKNLLTFKTQRSNSLKSNLELRLNLRELQIQSNKISVATSNYVLFVDI